MSEPLLIIEDVSKYFGGVMAVFNVSFEVKKGELLGIIGPNGAGKTTLVNLLSGFVKPDMGKILFRGEDITHFPAHRRALMGIVRSFQLVRAFSHLPVFKNLVVPLYSKRARMFLSTRFGDRDHVALDLLEDVGFERDSSVPYKPAGALPHGYLKRLELAACLAIKPEVLILDELFSGMAMSEVAATMPVIEKLKNHGLTIIMVEHRLRELFRIADKVIVLNYGVKIAEGTPEEIAVNEKVREAYLGVDYDIGS